MQRAFLFVLYSEPQKRAKRSERKETTKMAEHNYYQKEIETMPREEMRALQSEKLVRQVKRVFENVKY
jgi:hypothetical protein